MKKGDEEASGGKWKKHKSSVSWSTVFYMFLIPANAFIVGGGSLLTGANADELNKETGKVSTSKALRTTGQTIFLIQTVIVVLLSGLCVRQGENKRPPPCICCLQLYHFCS